MTPREPTQDERTALLRRLHGQLPPEARRRVGRVAVSAVAAGERLGLSDEALMAVREAAELWPHPVAARQEALRQAPWLGAAVVVLSLVVLKDHGVEDEVVALAWALDLVRHPGEMEVPPSLKRSAWMPEVVAAFEAVDPLVQPLETNEDK